MYLVENNHPAIIDRDQFDAVQAEIARRAARHKAAPAPKGNYELTGKIRCGICGAPYGHKIAGSAPKYKKSVWICNTFNSLGKAHCPSQMIPEDILRAKIAEAGGMEGLREIVVPAPFLLYIIYMDSLTTIRKLKEAGCECYFEKENIWTFDGKGELLLTIIASLAQEENF